MSSFNNYTQVKQHLLNMPKFSEVGGRAAHFALDQINVFSEAIGNPHRDFASIHVAGTNGKGTVCAMLASVYSQAGYKTGLFTSPHLKDVRERFRIDGNMISEGRILEFFNTFERQIRQYPITFFELTTAIAFWYFSQEKVDLAIIETGLGGRLDATNIVDPEVAVITSIGMDHIEQLGSNITDIAREKAGILKAGRPFVSGNLCAQSASVIDAISTQKGCKKVITTPDCRSHMMSMLNDTVKNCPKPFWNNNISICVDVFVAAAGRFPVEPAPIADGLALVCKDMAVKGRFEKIHSEMNMYFDGAHNQDALSTLISHAVSLQPPKSIIAVVSLMLDKLDLLDHNTFNACEQLYYFEMKMPRAANFERFQSKYSHARLFSGTPAEISAVCESAKSKLVLFTGSFYFYSIVSEWMESIAPVPKTN
jgi:dihydrofolate synthase / folylpolyglutamate synthase